MNQTQRVGSRQTEEWVAPQRKIQQEPIIITRHITRGEKALWTFASVILFTLAICMVANQATLFSVSRDVAKLQNNLENQQKVTQQLKSESDSLSSPERIVKYAENELGLKLNINNIKVLP
ncbi:MAG: cell division protein FtsL [Sporolactobacillus sp.]